MNKTILLTGFEPFAGELINPSWEIAKRLNQKFIKDYQIISHQLECAFGTAGKHLLELVQQYNPDIVISLGQAGGRTTISLEKVAINFIDARIADNNAKQIIDEPINPIGKTAYFSNLPLSNICHELNNQAIPCVISYTAGTFVCNYVFYTLMEHIDKYSLSTKGGFVHVPFIPEQVVKSPLQASMALDTMINGVQLILENTIHNNQELKISNGTLF